jgi:hypothetical protein
LLRPFRCHQSVTISRLSYRHADFAREGASP